MTDRRDYIRRTYRLETIVDASQVRGYRAVYQRPDGSVFSSIEGTSRVEVVRIARCRWGHFNFNDEAEAFAEVFPPSWA